MEFMNYSGGLIPANPDLEATYVPTSINDFVERHCYTHKENADALTHYVS